MEITRRSLLAAGVGTAGLSAIGVPLAGPATAAPGTPVTERVFLTGTDADHTVDWEFRVTAGRRSGVWSTIPTPSNWEFHGFGSYNYGSALVPDEKGDYRRTFAPPTSWAGRRIFLAFEASMTDTGVRVNGVSAGPVHQGGFYRFRYDVTSLVELGESNLLEVTVSKESADNSVNNAERRGDYWNFGGIFRPVTLEAHPAARVDRVAVDARADGTFSAEVALAGVGSAGRITGQIRRLDGSAVGGPFSVAVPANATRATLTTTTDQPLRWTAETPNLHQVDVTLTDGGGSPLHTTATRFGFRTVEVRAGDGLYVNGKRVVLKGANRHTFWPTLGRASSPRLARLDIGLMKDMNMNAVRMSHYPPDDFFLDLCDELGLYVLDELAGWQKRYDEGVGAPLVAATVTRDVNHPSILFWDNGNEGGWNTALDDDFAQYDPQKRKVLHPWASFGGVDTSHYQNYSSTVAKAAGSTVFMPTEFLHGLYDGGAGAGLNDYWKVMGGAQRSAGGFIWSLVDESVVRDDRGGAVDTAGNLAPDGILGPFREKEASFHTIKDIWSPVQLANPGYYASTFPTAFDKTVKVVNRYDFTGLDRCRFTWQLLKFNSPGSGGGHTVVTEGAFTGPGTAPGATGSLSLGLPTTWTTADALSLTAKDATGREISAWTWRIKKAADHAARLVVPTPGSTTATEDSSTVTMTAGTTRVTIGKSTGRLVRVLRDGTAVSLTNGPALAVGTAELTGLQHFRDGTGWVVQADYTGDLTSVRWRLDANGWLRLEYGYHRTGNHDFLGVSFDYPEAQVRDLTWLGDGPHGVYKNRMRGATPDVWTKAYNNTAVGASGWQYPQFKGYHANVCWAELTTSEGAITVVSAEEGLFLRLFTPAVGVNPQQATAPYPAGGLSFLDGVPPIGNKFHDVGQLGPESAPNVAVGNYHRSLYFHFR
ncbi:glycoside hydrolase family 2 TIM barrel-domain containing protein [Umezawaea sp. Da 62-37]|uniref:glycoside hydrolase family 2 TIM barrel-domain containing protein n=1 Tax=Umezawaea sp. Da 62-37 TaxID=3075927 RepID=UPI0028F71CC5|nr:glycoside hydrolase family 2 TIM barrel-domain containing protein [Umezawaea sp. Da 62-37]WNV85457.1 glycoside hydrolase family 2 TIM barrel-domain containing protein [Umezawaea sp. Da 62-37]